MGIYVDKGLKKAVNIFIPIFSVSDSFLLIYAQKLIHNNKARIVVTDNTGIIKQNPEIKGSIEAIERTTPGHISLYHEKKIDKDFLLNQHLMLISFDSWRKAVETRRIWLPQTPYFDT